MIHIQKKAFLKLKYFTLGTEGEISGLGKSSFEDEMVILEDIEILKQKCTGMNTVLDEGAMAQFLNELIKKGENPAEWNVWWHSHADMGAFWSTTDDSTIEETTSPYLVSIVINNDLNFLTRVDVFKPFRFTFNDELRTLKGHKGRSKKIKEYCENKIKKCVTYQKPFWKKIKIWNGWKFQEEEEYLNDNEIHQGSFWKKNKHKINKNWNKKNKRKKGSKDKAVFLIPKQHKKRSRSLVRVTSEDKQRGVWQKWGSKR